MKKKLRLQALEPRILLDAAAVVTAVESFQDSSIAETSESVEPVVENNCIPEAVDTNGEAEEGDGVAATGTATPEEADISGGNEMEIVGEAGETPIVPLSDELNDRLESVAVQGNDIVVIDQSIHDYQSLLTEISTDVEVIEIGENEAGLARLSELLEGRSEVNTLHIFSHGSQGSLNLGSTVLSEDTITEHQAILEEIGSALAADGDILLYGCNIAEGEVGIEFISQLSIATASDIAASDDTTGSADAGGDWELEISSGIIEAQSLSLPEYTGTLGFGGADVNGDGNINSLRMITWNVIGLDSNKPDTEGPNVFMVGMRINADGAGLTDYTVKIVDDDGIDIFGTGFTIGDSTVASDFDDGVDNIQFTGKTIYEGVSIDAVDGFADGLGGFYRDFYFNVEVERTLDSHDQIQPFHFEVFDDADNDGIWDVGETGEILDNFSWLPDDNAANTPLYLYVEKYISQARNDVTDQTYPTEAGADDSYAAIRIEGYADTGNYTSSPVTVFVGQDLNIRVEGQTATQGYPQLTLSTVFDTDYIQINSTYQFYDQPITDDTYQQDLGTGDVADGNFDDLTNVGTEDANTSIYANPAGWNPATHSTMVTSAPPKAGGGPIVTDYNVTITGTGSGTMDTLILDYSGSSFHYNADFDNGIEGIDYVRFNAVMGAIEGNVAEDIDGDNLGDTNLAGVAVSLTGDVNDDGVLETLLTATDANGNYRFDGYWGKDTNNNGIYDDISGSTDSSVNPGDYTWMDGILPNTYTVTESAVAGYGDVADYGNGVSDGVNDNSVTVTLDTDAVILEEGGVLYGVATADFVEGRPDLQLTKAVDNSAPGLGEDITFTLTVTNTSQVTAGLVEVTEKLPAGLTYVSDNSGGSYDAATGVWSVGSVAADSSETISITVTVNDAAPITNFAEITTVEDGLGNSMADPDSTPGNNAGPDGEYGTADDGTRTPFEDDEARVTVDASEADLSLVKTVSDRHPSVGDTITFSLILTNSGPDDATNIIVTDELPSGIDPATVTLTAASVGSFDSGSGLWTIAALANGATATLTFSAVVDEASEFTNHAAVTAVDQYDPDSDPNSDRSQDDHSDGVADDDEASVIITPQAADLSLNLVADNTTPDVGDTVIYTMILNNSGPDTATGVVVSQILPAGVTYLAGGSSYNAGTRTVTWDAGDLTAGDTMVQTVSVQVDNNGTLISTAEVASTSNFAIVSDPDSKPADEGGTTAVDDWSDGIGDDDEASVTLTPGAADLSLTKSVTVNEDGILNNLDDTVTFTLTVTNDSGNPAYNLRIEDTMSAGLTWLSTDSVDGSYDSATGLWSINSLGANASATLIFTANVDSVLAQSNFAEIIEADLAASDTAGDGVSTLIDSDSTFDNDNGNQIADEDDEALVTMAAIPYADLEVETTVSNPSVIDATEFDFYITVTNNGPNPVTGVVVENIISGTTDNKFTLVSWSSDSPSSYVSPNDIGGTWTVGALAVGEQITLTLTGSCTDNTPAMTNFAQVTASDLPDPDSTVNNGISPDPVEDDEDAVSTGAASSRYDVALSQTVSRDGGKTAGDTLILNDQVTFALTAANEGSEIVGNAYIINRWAAGLNLVSTTNSDVGEGGLVEYSTDGGLSYSAVFNANPDFIRWSVDNSSSGGKFVAGTQATLTLVGSVNAVGETDNIAENSAWWSQMASKTDDDSSVPDVAVFTTADGAVGEIDLTTDDLNDGQRDDDETSVSVGGSQTADLSVTKQISIDGTQTFTETARLDDEQVVTFRISVTNDSNSVATATNVFINEVLPVGLVYMRSYGDGSYSDTDADSSPDTWDVGDLSRGATASLYIVARVDWDLTASSTITNQIQVSAVDQTDPDSVPDNDDGDQSEDDEASLTITEQLPEADLSLSKTISDSSPSLNSDVTFTLTVSNNGPNDATNVTVSDLLPSGLTYVSQSGTGVYADNDTNGIYDTWAIGTVASGSSVTINIVATVTSTDTITNFAEISHSDLDDPDSTPGNGNQNPDEDDEAAVSFTAQAADLSLSKSVSNATPNVGDTISFTLTVINSGPNATSGVMVGDAVPAGFTQTGLNFNATAAGDTFSAGVWTLGDVAVGEIHSLVITGTVDDAAAFSNFAQITASDLPDPDSTVNNDTDQTSNEDDEGRVTVTPQAADLSLSKSVDNSSPNVGDDVTFTLTLTNAGPSDSFDVLVADSLPPGLTLTGIPSGVGSYDGSTWDVGDIANGETVSISFSATVTSADPITNFAQVTQVLDADGGSPLVDPDSTVNNDGDQTTNEDDEAAITVDARQIDLSLAKAVSRSNPNVGEIVTFTLTVTNEGSDGATGVQITDFLPGPADTNFTYVAASASDGGVFAGGANTITWDNLDIAAGSIRVLTFNVVVKAGDPVENIAEVTATDQPDIDSTPDDGVGDDYATVAIDGQQADLSLVKTVDDTTPAFGDTVTFTLTVHNSGSDSATNVVVRDQLPGGLEYVSATGDGSYNEFTGEWTIATIGTGANAVLTLQATIKSPATLTNVAEIIASDQQDPDSTPDNDDGDQSEDDESSVSVNAEVIDLSLTKTIDNTAPALNDVVTYTVIVSNRGGFDTATGINVADVVPAGLDTDGAGHGVTVSAGSYAGGVWSGFNLAGGTSATLTITGRVINVTELSNTAEIMAANETDIDSTPGNGNDTPENQGEDDWATVSPNMGSISGKVLDDRSGFIPGEFDASDSAISGVTVELWADDGAGNPIGAVLQSTTTAADGSYYFSVVAGSYVVVETDSVGYISVRDMEDINPDGSVVGQTIAPGYNRIPVTVVAGNEYIEKNFLDLTPWAISGNVYNDDGATTGTIDGSDSGIDGIAVTLLQDTDGNIANGYEQTVATQITAAGGGYEFANLGAGLYRILQNNGLGYSDVTDSDGDTTDPEWNQIDVALLNGTGDSINNDFLDVIVEVAADITYAISSTPNISEDLMETATFTITLAGDVLQGSNTSSIVITATGTGTTGTDYDNYLTAVTDAAAVTAGVNYDAGTQTLTFDASFNGTGTGDFSFTMDAIDDNVADSGETIIGTLSAAAISNGTAVINIGSTTTTITDNDEAIDFAINSTVTISEDATESTTFTVTLDNAVNAGNTATVNIALSGTATDNVDYTDAFLTAVADAATATPGVSYAAGVLSFDSNYDQTNPFNFSMTAVDDMVSDSGETITGTLSGATISNGTATISTAISTTTITDNDEVIDFAINSTATISEDATESTNFTVTLDNAVNAGNTATVNIALSGTATDNVDYTDAFLTAVADAATATSGVSYAAGVLSFDSSYDQTNPFNFSMTAVDDMISDSGETITGTLSGATISNGTATISTAISTTTITDNDEDTPPPEPEPEPAPEPPSETPLPPEPPAPLPPVVDNPPTVWTVPPATDPLPPPIFVAPPLQPIEPVVTDATAFYTPSMNPVSLAGEVRDLYLSEGVFEMSVGDGEFEHSNSSERLSYEAILADGSELPEYIHFVRDTGMFRIDSDTAISIGVESIQVKVTASDSVGNAVSDTFEIRFGKEAEGQEHSAGSREIHPITLTGYVTDQLITASGEYSFSIANAFHHSDAVVVLKYTATMNDKSALPDYVHFDPQAGMFYVDSDAAASAGIKVITVVITAYDPSGNELSTILNINIDLKEESPFSAGKPSLMEQIQSTGDFGYQQERQGLVDNLQALFGNAV